MTSNQHEVVAIRVLRNTGQRRQKTVVYQRDKEGTVNEADIVG